MFKIDRNTKIKDLFWPRMGPKRYARYIMHKIVRLRASPRFIGGGLAVGILVSFTPFLGFHLGLCISVAWLLGYSIPAAIIGSFVGNPVTLPFMFYMSYAVGRLAMHLTGYVRSPNVAPMDVVPMEAVQHFTVETIIEKFAHYFMPMAIGSILIAIIVGPFMVMLCTWFVATLQATRRKVTHRKLADGHKDSDDDLHFHGPGNPHQGGHIR